MPATKPAKAPSRMGVPAAGVDAYLAALPDDKRAALEKIRAAIRSVAPDAAEGIGYGMPYYKHMGRPLIGFSAFKNHCSIFPMSGAVIERIPELRKYDIDKGTIRFPIGKPPPTTLIRRLVRARQAEIESKSRGK